MEVNPDELVRLAAQSESAARVLATQWVQAQASLAVAHESLGDTPAADAVAEAYGTATVAADDVVRSLAQVLLTGVQALEQTAYDAREADEKVTETFRAVRGGRDDDAGAGHGRGGHHEGGGPGADRHERGDGRGDGHGHGHGRGRGKGGH